MVWSHRDEYAGGTAASVSRVAAGNVLEEVKGTNTGTPWNTEEPACPLWFYDFLLSMPELPEVETIARGLAKRVTGDVIESVWLGQKKEPLKSPAAAIVSALEQTCISAVRRIGKHIVFDLDRRETSPLRPEKQRARLRRQRPSVDGASRKALAGSAPSTSTRTQWIVHLGM